MTDLRGVILEHRPDRYPTLIDRWQAIIAEADPTEDPMVRLLGLLRKVRQDPETREEGIPTSLIRDASGISQHLNDLVILADAHDWIEIGTPRIPELDLSGDRWVDYDHARVQVKLEDFDVTTQPLIERDRPLLLQPRVLLTRNGEDELSRRILASPKIPASNARASVAGSSSWAGHEQKWSDAIAAAESQPDPRGRLLLTLWYVARDGIPRARLPLEPAMMPALDEARRIKLICYGTATGDEPDSPINWESEASEPASGVTPALPNIWVRLTRKGYQEAFAFDVRTPEVKALEGLVRLYNRDQPAFILDIWKPLAVKEPGFRVLKVLCAKDGTPLTLEELERKSTAAARSVLERLIEDTDWARVIQMSGKTQLGYRLVLPAETRR